MLDFKRKIQTYTRIRTLDFQISSLALSHLSYSSSIDSTGPNLSLESVVVCDTICHHLTGELASSLFIYSDILK